MVEKHFYEQANLLLKVAYSQLRDFDWDFYQTTAKVKLKQLQHKGDLKDRSIFLEELSESKETEDYLLQHNQLKELFETEFEKFKE